MHASTNIGTAVLFVSFLCFPLAVFTRNVGLLQGNGDHARVDSSKIFRALGAPFLLCEALGWGFHIQTQEKASEVF